MKNKTFIIDENNITLYIEKICTWISSKVKDTHSNGVVLGMSGGVDSCVAARLCKLADVPIELAIMPYGDTMNKQDAMEFIEKFHFSYHEFDIKACVDSIVNSSTNLLANSNIRPRIRMTHLYHFAQTNNLLVCGTSNLSEITVGYFTKWGDGGSDFNPLGFLTKKEIYILAKALGIPESIMNKAPSAELFEGQTDEADLGVTYEQLDNYILSDTSNSPEIDKKIKQKILSSEHKIGSLQKIAMFND